MREVKSLGYVVVTSEDVEGWRKFGQECLGLQVAAAPDGKGEHDAVYFRSDERSWRLGVEQGPDGGLVALGFEVAGAEAMDGLALKLESGGFAIKHDADMAASREVSALLRTTDPAGIPLEFYYGAKVDKANFVSPTGARFVTGSEGFGHAVIVVDDLDEARRFYAGLLGFRLSDIIRSGPYELAFLSPNTRHHSLAYAQLPGAPTGTLQHIMLEVDDLDVVGRALDYCLDGGAPVQAMLGKHTNDHMISFYCTSPSVLTIEYGWHGRRVDDATHVTEVYDSASFWGHRPPDGQARQA